MLSQIHLTLTLVVVLFLFALYQGLRRFNLAQWCRPNFRPAFSFTTKTTTASTAYSRLAQEDHDDIEMTHTNTHLDKDDEMLHSSSDDGF